MSITTGKSRRPGLCRLGAISVAAIYLIAAGVAVKAEEKPLRISAEAEAAIEAAKQIATEAANRVTASASPAAPASAPGAAEALVKAREAASRQAWREVLDLCWPVVAADATASEARELLATAYEKLDRPDYAKQTRAGAQPNALGAWNDHLGHSRSAYLLARRPVEGLKAYARAGIGHDSNPARAPEDFSQAYLQTHGQAPATTLNQTAVRASTGAWLGIGGEFYQPLSPGYGFYLNADFGGSHYFSAGSYDQTSLTLGLGLAKYDAQSGLRAGLRAQSGHFGYALGSTTNARIDAMGLGIDYGQSLGGNWSASAGVGLDQFRYEGQSAADFRRVSVYASVTRQFSGPWNPTLQFGLSGIQDKALHTSLNSSGLATGPDRRETGWTLSASAQPAARWRLMAGFGTAYRSELSPNWSSLLIAYPRQTRLQANVGLQYQWSQQCTVQGRVGKSRVRADAALYAYSKLDLYLGVACWLN